MLTVVDELGHRLTLARPPQRIVSLVPSLTEWLFAIGLGARVVGVTDFCLRPAAGVAGKFRLRGTKNPDRGAICELAPDIVIANKEENRERDVVALTEAGLPVYVTDPRTVTAAITTLTELARLLDAVDVAGPLVEVMRAAYAATLAASARLPQHARVLALIWRDPWMAIGDDTYAADLLRMCGGINVAAELDGRYPRFELAALPTLRPDLILLPSEPYAFSAVDLPALRTVFDGPIHFVDGELLTWYGPRIAQALTTFSALLCHARTSER